MNVLVAGGAGYIGSNMTAMLAEAGHETIVFDNLSRGHRQTVAKTKFVQGDLADYDLLVKTLSEHKVEAVMHFAALIEVPESVAEPLKYYQNNFCCTRNLLQAMKTVGVGKFVFSSTAAVYGMPDEIPITENCPTHPINPYGQSKLAVEQMCRFQSQTGKLHYAALRYFNAAGAGNSGELGEDHKPESHLIPLIIHAALGKRDSISICGNDYETPDGTCIRDYIHVEDLCRHLLALDKLETEAELTYNLGNGKGYSVKQVIDTVRKVSGRDFKVVDAPRRPGDPPTLTADANRAQKELDWQPQLGELEKIVETAWKWHSQNPDGYHD